ncbi:unnamed protein product [Protopolystoma xenopodis]|uniref:Uncharacterized protein n=1 Tax=Protopolystoma xenopodis TaxID=117903 RepID=A0A448WF63_9PLAT|nr:unnamed protein product [Protopolystoma xenopodis]
MGDTGGWKAMRGIESMTQNETFLDLAEEGQTDGRGEGSVACRLAVWLQPSQSQLTRFTLTPRIGGLYVRPLSVTAGLTPPRCPGLESTLIPTLGTSGLSASLAGGYSTTLAERSGLSLQRNSVSNDANPSRQRCTGGIELSAASQAGGSSSSSNGNGNLEDQISRHPTRVGQHLGLFVARRVETRRQTMAKTLREVVHIAQEILHEVELQEPRFISTLKPVGQASRNPVPASEYAVSRAQSPNQGFAEVSTKFGVSGGEQARTIRCISTPLTFIKEPYSTSFINAKRLLFEFSHNDMRSHQHPQRDFNPGCCSAEYKFDALTTTPHCHEWPCVRGQM